MVDYSVKCLQLLTIMAEMHSQIVFHERFQINTGTCGRTNGLILNRLHKFSYKGSDTTKFNCYHGMMKCFEKI